MKITFSFLLMIMPIYFFSQTFESLLGTDRAWHIQSSTMTGPSYGSLTYTGDTTVSSNLYKIYQDELSLNTGEAIYLVREDTTQGKVWLRSELGETVFYDYNLQQGQQFTVTEYTSWGNNNYTFDVDTTYMVSTPAGLRKKFELSLVGQGLFSTHNFIEGVGSLNHPFTFGPGLENNFQLICATSNSSLVYTDGSSNCLLSNIEQLSFDLNIYPNPANEVINIDFGNNSSSNTLKIYDLIGNHLYGATITNSTTSIKVNDYAKGTYFIRVSNGKSSVVKTFVID